MGYSEAHDPHTLAHYEGLVHSTADRIVHKVELEREDIEQLLRVKVYRALLSFDPAKKKTGAELHRPRASCRCRRCKYVFMCVRDQAKDILDRKRHGVLLIDDLAAECIPDMAGNHTLPRDQFDADHGLLTTHEAEYGSIEDDDLVLPNTLSALEREIVVRLYRDYNQTEVRRQLGLPRPAMERAVKAIREKLADWRPTVVPFPDSPYTTERAKRPEALRTPGSSQAVDEAQAA